MLFFMAGEVVRAHSASVTFLASTVLPENWITSEVAEGAHLTAIS